MINTHSLHNAHLLRRSLPRDLIAPVPFINPSQRQAEHAKLAAEWRENPKSYTAQGRAREKKRADADEIKGKKKARQGKKHSANEAFRGWGDLGPKEEVKEEMVLLSDLSAPLPFLGDIYNNGEGSQLESGVVGID